MSYFTPQDPRILQAERVVSTTYSDTVSVAAKGKNLNKFGRNRLVGISFETVAEFQGTVSEETFVTTNIIDSIVSSSGSDTSQTITIEGHTIDGSGNLTFVSQDAALNGQTEVTLSTPLARATRAFVKASGSFGSTPTALAGNVAVYDNTDGISSGVPVTAAATKLMILLGETQSEKAATALSQSDYWFISYFSAEIGDAAGPTNFATVRMETRDIANGGAWRPLGKDYIVWPDTADPPRGFDPFLIVPKNHDWRVSAKSDGGTCTILTEAGGFLAAVQ